MSSIVQGHQTPTASSVFTDRCRVLGLPVWQIDEAGVIDELPTGWGPVDHWLRSPLLMQWITREIQGSRGSRSHQRELFPGCWLLSMPHMDSDGRSVFTLVMMMGSEILNAEQLHTICASARIDVPITRTALSPLARYERADLDRVCTMLAWMHEDLAENVSSRHAIESFSAELADVYEQVTLLFRLGKSINRLHEPREFVELACSMLFDTLDFEWVSVVLKPRSMAATLVEREYLLQGGIPCEKSRLLTAAAQVSNELVADAPTVILSPDEHPMARLADAEVVIDPIFCGVDMMGLVAAGNKGGRDRDVSSIDTQLVKATAEFIGSFLHSASVYHEQRAMFLGTVRAFISTIEAKDRYTRGHSDRVGFLAGRLAQAAGLDEEQVRRIRLAGLLHDVGKIGVPEAVLTKPSRLTDEEFEAIKRHPVIGYTILKDIEPLEDILPGVLYHHERWDGGGYPAGLEGERIPLIARILAVADMFDAMSSTRAYREAIDREKVLTEVRERAGSQLDPELAKLFLSLDLAGYDKMIQRHRAKQG